MVLFSNEKTETQKDLYIQLISYAGENKHRQPEVDQLISIAAEPEEIYSPDTNIRQCTRHGTDECQSSGNDKRSFTK